MTTSGVQYFLLTLLAGCCLPTSGVTIQRKSSINRVQCMESLGTCYFYSRCTESMFPCGEEGVGRSYAEQRCTVSDNLDRRLGRMCRRSCVSLIALQWVADVEECFQNRFLDLVQNYVRQRLYHDPLVCLRLEHEADLELNYCFNQSSVVHQIPEVDLKTLVSIFHIGGKYYDSMVDRGLPEVIKDRRSALAAQLVTASPMVRLIFCIKGKKYKATREIDNSPDDFIRVVRSNVYNGYSVPLFNFHYGGIDDHYEDHPCFTHQPVRFMHNTESFHLVTLFVKNSSIYKELEWDTLVHLVQNDSIIIGFFYELTTVRSKSTKPPRKITECGNGRRQATEECDYGGGSSRGCSINCRVVQGYDCGTARLQPSVCWLEVCGDGMRTRGEACDDHNIVNGDGCDNSCQVESTTHTCTQTYNRTSICTPRSLLLVKQVSQASKVSISWIVPSALTVLAASLVVVK